MTKSQMRTVIALLGLAGACAPEAGQHTPPPEPPAATPEPVPCAAPETPRRRAREAELRGQSKWERYPFAPEEGPRALALLSEAAHCLELARDEDAATALRRRGARLSARIEGDYRELRIRLERALAARRDGQALRATRRLRALLQDRRGPYASHLRTLEHGLSHRVRGGS
ncbi:MAG: hypothetical protein PVI30_02800 [Myxococcales bacterium]|jgi:hypothetical protein